jgi:polysaccharide biosynthesis transport protein
LQPNGLANDFSYPSGPSSQVELPNDPRYYLALFLRNKSVLTLCAFGGLILALLFTFPQTPIYQALATIEVQPPVEEAILAAQTRSSSAAGGQTFLPTQVVLLTSVILQAKVVERIGPEKVLEVLQVPSRFDLWWDLVVPKDFEWPSWFPKKTKAAIAAPSAERLGRSLAGSVQARIRPGTQVVEISVESVDPEFASKYANTLAEEFISQAIETRWQQSRRTTNWLSSQIDEVKYSLEASEDRLQEYARSYGIIYSGEQASIDEQKLRQIQQDLATASSARILQQSRRELAIGTPISTLGDVLDDPALRSFQTQLADLRNQLASKSTTLTENHPDIVRLRAQMAELQESIGVARENILKRISNDYESAKRREDLLRDEFEMQLERVAAVSAGAVQYGILKREVDTNRALYDSMLQRVKEAGITSALRASNVRVVDPAPVPGSPIKPRPVLNAAIGMVLGMVFGLGLVLVQERSNRYIRSPGDCHSVTGVDELGFIPELPVPEAPATALPRLSNEKRSQSKSNRRLQLSLSQPSQAEPQGDSWLEDLPAITDPKSSISEAFRLVVTSLNVLDAFGALPKAIAISSAHPGEGKTTICANLGATYASLGKRVLLIDADLRRPNLYKRLQCHNKNGLTAILRSDQPIAEQFEQENLLQSTPVENLFLLAGGMVKGSPSSLLFSPRLPEMLKLLSESFDHVFIDSPPMIQMADARILSRAAGHAILVVKAGDTEKSSFALNVDRLQQDDVHIVGTILNAWNPKVHGNYQYGYGYGYRYYGGRYYYSNKAYDSYSEDKPRS